MKKNIFISSTFEDLQPYRKAVWELLEKFEVHVNGMERFGARTETSIDTCLQAVERSDIYLGIIAHRFGSIHTEYGKSYTQLEYEKAVEHGQEILIYLIDEEASIKPKYVDFGEPHEKLENFKKLLKEKHTVDFFCSPEDLVQKLKNRFGEFLTTKENEDFFDDYNFSKDVLDKFHLFPKKYNDREVKLKIKFKNEGFPASKGICDFFGFNFGETLGVPIEIIEPEIKGNKIKYLFITEDKSDFYFKNNELDTEIMGRLIFSDQRVANVSATFFDEEYTTRKLNPDYDPTRLSISAIASRDYVYNDKFIWEKNTIKGESTAAIIFVKEYPKAN